MPGRLIYRERVGLPPPAIVPAIVIPAGQVRNAQFPLSAQPRPDHPWSIASATLAADFQFQGTPPPLGATNDLVVTVALIAAGTKFSLWSQTYPQVEIVTLIALQETTVSMALDADWTDTLILDFTVTSTAAAGSPATSWFDRNASIGFFGNVN